MLEKLDFQTLVEQTVTSKRIPRAMDLYRFVLGIVLGLYVSDRLKKFDEVVLHRLSCDLGSLSGSKRTGFCGEALTFLYGSVL